VPWPKLLSSSDALVSDFCEEPWEKPLVIRADLDFTRTLMFRHLACTLKLIEPEKAFDADHLLNHEPGEPHRIVAEMHAASLWLLASTDFESECMR